MASDRANIRFPESIAKMTAVAGVMILALVCPFNIFSVNPQKPYHPVRRQSATPVAELPDSLPLSSPLHPGQAIELGEISTAGDTLTVLPLDTIAVAGASPQVLRNDSIAVAERKYIFNPDPTRAVWLSALFPGLGQLYNRRYWKLPIVVGAFMGLGYATSWNNGMLRDYTRAYTDLMDNDPSTRSYMDFFPPTTREEDLNKTWLTNVMKSRKDYYRRNRDLCIIAMVGVYLVAMVDAYVDASLAHFDISPNLTMDMGPAIIPESHDRLPGVGLQWALNF